MLIAMLPGQPELQELARATSGAPTLMHHQWRQGWLINQLSLLENARQDLVDQVALATTTHPYACILESLPVKSAIWTATLIGAIGDIDRFRNASQFKAYLGWDPQLSRSGSSIDSSELAKRGVRPARNVLGQMTVIMLSSTIRSNPFRDVYQRLTARGMRPAAALGRVAGKLSAVLYGMLKTTTPYDERNHRKQLGLLRGVDQTSSSSVEVALELVDLADSNSDRVAHAQESDDLEIVLWRARTKVASRRAHVPLAQRNYCGFRGTSTMAAVTREGTLRRPVQERLSGRYATVLRERVAPLSSPPSPDRREERSGTDTRRAR